MVILYIDNRTSLCNATETCKLYRPISETVYCIVLYCIVLYCIMSL